jgi:hypothetical protein
MKKYVVFAVLSLVLLTSLVVCVRALETEVVSNYDSMVRKIYLNEGDKVNGTFTITINGDDALTGWIDVTKPNGDSIIHDYYWKGQSGAFSFFAESSGQYSISYTSWNTRDVLVSLDYTINSNNILTSIQNLPIWFAPFLLALLVLLVSAILILSYRRHIKRKI